jgi:DNA-binding NtrC family response regulator
MSRKSILAVDDEPAVLEALRRHFRTLRREWVFVTAANGQAALESLGAQTFDAVVTDMRMPAMHGLALLERVKDLQPHALRILLSGQIDPAVETARTEIAHYSLSKPCSAETIVGLIDRYDEQRGPEQGARRRGGKAPKSGRVS